MPLYEYQCDECGNRFEVIQQYKDAPIAVCPKCGGAVTKQLSSPAIQFKGSGFYITDYARKTEGATTKSGEAKGDSAGESKSDGQTESKSESKAESKTESKTETKSDTKSESKPATSGS